MSRPLPRPLPKRGTVVLASADPLATHATRVRSNGVMRQILSWEDLTAKERKEHDWAAPAAPDGYSHYEFIRYRGCVTPLENFQRLDAAGEMGAAGWDGAAGDSYFSGLVLRLVDDDAVIVGAYCTVSA